MCHNNLAQVNARFGNFIMQCHFKVLFLRMLLHQKDVVLVFPKLTSYDAESACFSTGNWTKLPTIKATDLISYKSVGWFCLNLFRLIENCFLVVTVLLRGHCRKHKLVTVSGLLRGGGRLKAFIVLLYKH